MPKFRFNMYGILLAAVAVFQWSAAVLRKVRGWIVCLLKLGKLSFATCTYIFEPLWQTEGCTALITLFSHGVCVDSCSPGMIKVDFLLSIADRRYVLRYREFSSNCSWFNSIIQFSAGKSGVCLSSSRYTDSHPWQMIDVFQFHWC